MKPKDRLELARSVIGDIVKAWDTYESTIAELAEPSMGGGGGRPSGISDPTGTAAAAGEPWTQHRRETVALITELLGNARGIERRMVQVVSATSKPDKTTTRCSGQWDATCTEMASVGPTGRPDRAGMCIRCGKAEQRAKKATA